MTRLQKILLFLLISLGALLRLYKLDASPWGDELVSMLLIRDGSWKEAVFNFNHANNHLFYTLLTKIIIQFLGESIPAFRFIPFLFGVLSIPAVFFLASLIHGPRTGLISAFLMTFSFSLIHYSQECRGYSGSLFFGILSTFYFLKLSEGRWKGKWALLYAVSIISGALFHLLNLSVFLCHCLTAWSFWAREKIKGIDKGPVPPRLSPDFLKRYFFTVLLITVVLSIVLSPMLHQLSSTYRDFTSVSAGSKNLMTWEFLTEFFGYAIGLPFNPGAVLALFLALAFALSIQWKRTPVFAFFSLLLLILPFLLYRVLNPASVVPGVLPSRFFLHHFPFIYILAAITLHETARLLPRRAGWSNTLLTLFLFLLIIPNLLITRNYFINGRQHWGEIFEHIRAKPGSVVTSNGVIAPLAFQFYKKTLNLEERGIRLVPKALLPCEPRDREKWLIYIHDPDTEGTPDLYTARKTAKLSNRVFFKTERFLRLMSFPGYGGPASSTSALYYSPGSHPGIHGLARFVHRDNTTRKFRQGFSFKLEDPSTGKILATGILPGPGLEDLGKSGLLSGTDYLLHEEGRIYPRGNFPVKMTLCYKCGIRVRINDKEILSDPGDGTVQSRTYPLTDPATSEGFSVSLDYHHHKPCKDPLLNFFILHEEDFFSLGP